MRKDIRNYGKFDRRFFQDGGAVDLLEGADQTGVDRRQPPDRSRIRGHSSREKNLSFRDQNLSYQDRNYSFRDRVRSGRS